ncbi:MULTISPECIES: metal-dependent transcriptional regulator [Archaeoglobus]|jgi:DtxR family Mn-dependent transcriptional regulator|uniref:Iron-dependent repressor n=3 Tax=Archaeoglobus fulgidus TaxID=2234 RepID=O28489_ARCFU|nr:MULTISPECIES: metal-dependent transcriptional regulator [Archaeoglobus]AAB89462.1 iron-dependent repressor [Archaeoglobus fulgidus DSM 4304]AIG98786.1 Mn-dependent transcriptional regulator [Archaeoglobus fulgidus DSM 8774]KUJ93304.1 MAG: Iron-dependent repressor [Archaeoglobus fulgidus]KUK06983.1 MAG: Iron-dependent repressor [Archaeoglobus fulgidus]MDI3496715.1 DtxR family transcriptional regulator, Mn-dependent transcriptional regulator [Archaeoglobus sp.]
MERIEEYLEAIYDIQEETSKVAKTGELAKILNVKPSSVTEMLIKLRDMGYVDYQPYKGAKLTRKGEELARRIKKYYLALYHFFKDYLGIQDELAEKLSCELEHHITEDAFVRVCRIISGNCEVCESCTQEYLSLSDATEGEYEVIVAPSYLAKIGLKPGEIVSVVDDEVETPLGKFRVDESVKKLVILSRF